jgi:hypothetical protein
MILLGNYEFRGESACYKGKRTSKMSPGDGDQQGVEEILVTTMVKVCDELMN